jgi:hypothetical protein
MTQWKAEGLERVSILIKLIMKIIKLTLKVMLKMKSHPWFRFKSAFIMINDKIFNKKYLFQLNDEIFSFLN